MKKKTNISDKALELINQQKLKPIPRWEFVVKSWGLWMGFGASLVLLALGVGISWFGLADNIIVPHLWLLVAIVFVVLAYLLFENTKRAYRFEKWRIFVFILVVGLVVGGVVFRVGIASRIDRKLESDIPYYRQIVPMKMEVWSRPEMGYLSGVITKVVDEDSFEIRDFEGNLWNVDSQDSLIRGRVVIETGEEIKLIGKRTGKNQFKAEEVRPWSGGRN